MLSELSAGLEYTTPMFSSPV